MLSSCLAASARATWARQIAPEVDPLDVHVRSTVEVLGKPLPGGRLSSGGCSSGSVLHLRRLEAAGAEVLRSRQ